MEQIIEAGGEGIQIKDGDAVEAVRCLQAVVLLEKLLGEKIPGNRFEAGKITGGKKNQNDVFGDLEMKLLQNTDWNGYTQKLLRKCYGQILTAVRGIYYAGFYRAG